jgi:hypothetical protein
MAAVPYWFMPAAPPADTLCAMSRSCFNISLVMAIEIGLRRQIALAKRICASNLSPSINHGEQLWFGPLEAIPPGAVEACGRFA